MQWKPVVAGVALGAVAVVAIQQLLDATYKPRKRGSVRFGNYPAWGNGRTAEEFLADKAKAAVIRGKNDPEVRLYTINLIREAGLDGRQQSEIASLIQQHVRDNKTYIFDPVRTEVFQEAVYTLTVANAGDCDDQAIAVAAMLMSVGINARLVLLSLETPFDEKTSRFTHIFAAAILPEGREMWLETIVPGAGADFRYYHTAVMRVELTPGLTTEKKIEVDAEGGSGVRAPVPGMSGLELLSGLA